MQSFRLSVTYRTELLEEMQGLWPEFHFTIGLYPERIIGHFHGTTDDVVADLEMIFSWVNQQPALNQQTKDAKR